MFLKKSTIKQNNKTYFHYKIVESYRESGKVKHRILFNIGPLSDDQAERLRTALKVHDNPDIIVTKPEQIVVTKHAAYLDVAVLNQLWHEWQFHKFFSQDLWIQALVINRCTIPKAKINIKDWLEKTIIPAYLGITDPTQLDKFEVYRALDRLYKSEGELQTFLFRQIKKRWPDTDDAFFYDITSTYLTGSRCIIAKLGYSRDHRPDCEQIVIALMITPKGYPFYWRVMPGNTQDITTINPLIEDIKERFGLKKCTMVFDRGMVSTNNIDAIESENWTYVSAMDRDEVKKAVFFDIALPEPANPDDYEQIMAKQEFLPFDKNAFLYYREFTLDGRRYILTFDVARFFDEHHAQLNNLASFIQWITEKNQSLREAKKKRCLSLLEREVAAMLKRKHLKKWVSVKIEPYDCEVINKRGKTRTVQSFQISYTIDTTAQKNEQRIHGITCFITNLDVTSHTAIDIIKWYRRKNKVEEAFHEIKDHLELRPIYLTREQRVKAHVIICVLAYFFFNDIEYRLKENNLGYSTEEVFGLLKECLINRLAIQQTNRSWLSITQPSLQSLEILNALKCDVVIDKKRVEPVLKAAESWL